ncbi:MAG: FAD-binding domain-containing protein [Pseudomonadota bacterium]
MAHSFSPDRTAALHALKAFVPKAGPDYAARRNYDRPDHPDVSGLSPYIRHRLVTETEVLEAVLARHSARSAEKFVQEVFWRTYFKGWLELRPSVWTAYRAGLARAHDRLATESGLRDRWERTCTGSTGIAAMDHWATDLAETGYLHNHARMWFASIWTFTLGLPWELGADFFLRHLLDGDPASNTLGWRWVVGLHTPGKVYVARPSNIAKYTEGRFGGLSALAVAPGPAPGAPNPPRGASPVTDIWRRDATTGLLLTEDDLSPGWLLDDGLRPVSTAVLSGATARSVLEVSEPVLAFTRGAVADTRARYGTRLGHHGPVAGLTRAAAPDAEIANLVSWAREHRLDQVVAPYVPAGPSRDRLDALRPALSAAGIPLVTPLRAFDAAAWPHATHGFFRFKEKIPALLRDLKGLRAA